VAKQFFVASSSAGESCTAKLAEFFPEAVPVRIPVRVRRLGQANEGDSPNENHENTVIEFGTSEEVVFASDMALDFEDRIRLENSDGSLDTEAEIVALQFHHGKTAVAARFREKVKNWIIQR